MKYLIESIIFVLVLTFSSIIFLLAPLFDNMESAIKIIKYIYLIFWVGLIFFFKNRWGLNFQDYITKESFRSISVVFVVTIIGFIVTYPIAFPNRFFNYILNGQIYFFTTQLPSQVSIKSILYYIPLYIIGPIIEEFTYRGLIQQKLYKTFNPLKSILIASFLFALMHIPIERFINSFLMGLFFGFIFHKYRSLTISIFVHLSFNLFATFTIPMGYTISSWLLLPVALYFGICAVFYVVVKNNIRYLKQPFY